MNTVTVNRFIVLLSHHLKRSFTKQQRADIKKALELASAQKIEGGFNPLRAAAVAALFDLPEGKVVDVYKILMGVFPEGDEVNSSRTVEGQYQFFLTKMKMNEQDMHPLQRKQLKQFFFGAWGNLLLFQRDYVASLSEEEAVAVFEEQFTEVQGFWKSILLNETGGQN